MTRCLPSDELRDHVRLACVPRIGSRLRRLLLERFGSPAAVFAASPAELAKVGGIGPRLAADLPTLSSAAMADDTIALCRERDVQIAVEGAAVREVATDGDAWPERAIPAHPVPDYPPLLSRIDDPPGLLFVRGTLLPQDSLAVAIVGSRHATDYGLRVAERLGGDLARAGYTVVSGLARGIDAAAHRGALAAGGRTIAVLGSGVLEVYPPEHEDLATAVTEAGAVISEQPPLASPQRGAFPQRNRIVSGLSLGVIVVQASERSGALITARLAGEQGREVFAVPGPIDGRMSRGCHRLIRDGAKLVERVDDVLEEFGPLFETTTAADGRAVRHAAELRLDDIERAVLDACDALAEGHAEAEGGSFDSAGRSGAGGGAGGGVSIDEIVESSGLAASQVLATLGVLEMRRLVRRLPGNRVARV